ncbi:LamG-like jellyroll fold domain-containing protein [Acinetobacter johnsonii]|uniref:LamG-like jellyroll fold domain-containing protein n=1 Tax=Acinetobacter johnsonii TaxID=40214 RepID=UPI00280E00AF|nr:LamG-like jellyroll fold domain-containing protein [Acinetobacter johnsonii]MDQ8974615.1 LamG-like jellyroll fold domain-containing protein [Acinetobacter johnsonii]
MANVKLEWLQATYVESFNIYRSDSPMNPASMPAPLATGITDNYYFDTGIIVDETYFYRVGAFRGNQELISSEVEVLAGAPVVNDPFWANVELLIFADATSFPSTALVDSSSRARTVYTEGSPQIIATEHLYDAGAIYTTGSAVQEFGYYSDLGIGTGDFTQECFLKVAPDAGTPSWATIFNLNSISLQAHDDATFKKFRLYIGGGNITNLTDLATSVKGEWHHFCMMRKSGVLYAFINGVRLASVSNTYSLTSFTLFGGGATASRTVKGYYNGCRVTRAARYSEAGFTVPTEKFPTS